MKDTSFNSNFSLNVQGILQEFNRPLVMGILNATPDSFYAKSRLKDVSEGIQLAQKMINEGVDILDIGGYSSRPGAADITEEEELNRVIKLIKEIRKNNNSILISIDTFRSRVAKKALLAGANIVNDITGGEGDNKMFEVVAEFRCPYIMMHMRGTPQTMQEQTDYDKLLKDIIAYFSTRIQKAEKAGINDIIIDPGFGFSKNTEQNFELLEKMDLFNMLNKPILVGLSRKSMIYKTLKIEAEDSLAGTIVLNTIALKKGASILRVHDIKEAKQTIRLLAELSKN